MELLYSYSCVWHQLVEPERATSSPCDDSEVVLIMIVYLHQHAINLNKFGCKLGFYLESLSSRLFQASSEYWLQHVIL